MISRRQMVAGTTLLAAGQWLNPAAGLANVVPALPFPMGVAAGDPRPDGFVIWTRLALDPLAPDGAGGMHDPVTVRWEVAEDEAMMRPVRQGSYVAIGALAHSVHIELEGLAPGRQYFYRFHALNGTSEVGRARTAPAPDAKVDHLRFVFASCSHWEEGYFTAYRRMAEEDPDFSLFLGDYIYEYNNSGKHLEHCVRQHPVREATDLASYRLRYALYKQDPDLRALHAAAACLMTWDDHEVQNDYANAISQDPSVPPDIFMRRRAAAYQAYYEHMPLRRRSLPQGADMRIYDRYRFGRLMEMPVLDGRQYRNAEACPLPKSRSGHVVPLFCTERDDPQRTMLGYAQEKWLFDGFRRSTAQWNVVAQDLLMAGFLQKGTDGTIGHWTDGWDGYPACRKRVLDAVSASRLANPVFLGGDIHSFWTTDLKADFDNPASATIATEFVGGSISANAPPYEPFAAMLPQNPNVRYFESRLHGYVAIDLTPRQMMTRFRSVDRRSDGSPASTFKSFVVEDGRRGALEV
ncbi:alkaline phosphatase D family protein [Novosphingobium sp. KACC 22771]|uniref:alkaline phosphatase D family protein n=1 Tax=Novosphingobium sp. KACC 22771 TaxID=3025670 RepID=UPI00236635B8|nr:alkaline phosphatase D family protein [Novosphingobium sp. KACC 22771]WDF70920.1 alkaline phosphatase D family protein [Novosphingobium sp. KACC 22771]